MTTPHEVGRMANLLYASRTQGNELAPPWHSLSDVVKRGYTREVDAAVAGTHPLVDTTVPAEFITIAEEDCVLEEEVIISQAEYDELSGEFFVDEPLL